MGSEMCIRDRRWNGELLVDVPKGVRRPLLAKLELRHGDAVVAAGSAALEAPYASNSGDVSPTVAALNTLLHRDVGGEEEAIQLRLEYALALASPPVVSDVDPDGTGENFSSGDAEAEFDGAGCGEAPKEPPTIGAAAGYPMPPLQIRCLRGKDVEVSPAKVRCALHPRIRVRSCARLFGRLRRAYAALEAPKSRLATLTAGRSGDPRSGGRG